MGKRLVFPMVISLTVILVLLLAGCTCGATTPVPTPAPTPTLTPTPVPTSLPVKVKFYSIADKERNLRGEFLGTVEYWGEGEIKINVTDANLERILKTDFIAPGGKAEEITLPSGEKVLRGGVKEYRAGTWEHLYAIINQSYSLGYVAELEE